MQYENFLYDMGNFAFICKIIKSSISCVQFSYYNFHVNSFYFFSYFHKKNLNSQRNGCLITGLIVQRDNGLNNSTNDQCEIPSKFKNGFVNLIYLKLNNFILNDQCNVNNHLVFKSVINVVTIIFNTSIFYFFSSCHLCIKLKQFKTSFRSV